MARFEILDEAPAGRFELVDEELPKDRSASSAAGKVAAGVAAGFADIGDTLLNAGAYLPGRLLPAVKRWNDERRAGLEAFNDERSDSTAFNLSRLVGNVAATWPVGGVVGAGVRGAAALPALARVAPTLEALGASAASGGLSTGRAVTGAVPRALDMGVRVAGGAATGAASAGLVNPEDAGTGALIGGALPPAVRALGATGKAVARTARKAFAPPEAAAAQAVLRAAGIEAPEEVAALRGALAAQRPDLLGETLTVPQIMQNPGVSQLQRTLRNAGETRLLDAEAQQNAHRLAALDRISPVTGTVQQAADHFGNAIEGFARPAEVRAGREVNAAYEAVDPFAETQFYLPLDRMEQARTQFLGPGTFGTGARANAGLAEARRIGQQELPPITSVEGRAPREQTLVKAVKRAGGINRGLRSSQELAGELKDLSQSGLGRVTYLNRGQSVDRMAEAMHERGFLPDADPVTLLNALRDSSGGERILASSADHGYDFRAGLERAMGDAPAAEIIPKTIPFSQVQNLRSSLGEAAEQASAKGANKEAAALRKMVSEIDAAVQNVAHGNGAPEEFFPPDIVRQWQEANRLHAEKMQRFHTGPQQAMFRKGGDNLPAAQGGELAPKFFNPARSQTEDIAGFQRLIGNDFPSSALKNYAITDAAHQVDQLGRLTNGKFGKWKDARSGAIAGLFNEGERATLDAVGASLQRAAAAENLGRAVGSNTAQNTQAALHLGLLDHPVTGYLANRLPFIRSFSGPILNSLRESAKRSRVDQLSGLLADPAALDDALGLLFTARQAPAVPGLLSGPVAQGLLSGGVRSAPLLGLSR